LITSKGLAMKVAAIDDKAEAIAIEIVEFTICLN
jgi:hypothetical protein